MRTHGRVSVCYSYGLALLAQLCFAAQVSAASDECQFIRDQVDKLSEVGGVVRVPAGTFNCKAPIIINKSNVILKGEGQGKSIFRLADNVHAPLLVIGSPQTIEKDGKIVTPTRVKNIDVSDLSFDGNKAHHNVKKECGESTCDNNATSIRNNAISIRGASYIHINNVSTHDSISGGLVTEKYCDHLKIENFDSSKNYFDGFAGYQTEHSQFINVNLHDNHGAGVSADIGFSKNEFIGGHLDDNHGEGIFARDSHGNTFKGTTINGNGNYGVFLSLPVDPPHPPDFQFCASDNKFTDVSIKHSEDKAFFSEKGCQGNQLLGHSSIEGSHSSEVYGDVFVGADVDILKNGARAPSSGRKGQVTQ